MSNLLRRALTALIAGSVAIAAIVWSSYGMWLFGLIVSMAGVWEFWNMSDSPKQYRWPAVIVGVLVWVSIALEYAGMLPSGTFWYGYLLIVPMLGLLLLYQADEERPIERLGELVLAFAYAHIPLVLFYLIAHSGDGYNFRIPIGLLIITWALDVGAFFAGKWFGKKPLFKRISPKKTWAGSIGGTIICLAIAASFQFWPEMQNGVSLPWIASGMIIALFGQWGDLIESMFKRSSKRKDSGSILPGHGGMLDRFDSMYITMPLLYILFSIL
ncbi:MAG: phosphatidate cytidylyltransferase [Bacteroidia bacterium]